MTEPFDPAHRLHTILAAARAYDGSQPARVVWAGVLGVAPEDRAGLFRALANLTDLVNEIESAIKERPGVDLKLFLGNLPSIRKAIEVVQLEASWNQQHAPKLSEAVVRDLLFCSNELQRFQPEEKIAPDSLSQLAKEVDALFKDVLKADIDPELRKTLLACLESFRRAIAQYHIRGAEGLREAAVKTLGELVFVRGQVNWKQPLIQRLAGIVMKAASLAATAMKFKALVDVARLALQAFDDADVLSTIIDHTRPELMPDENSISASSEVPSEPHPEPAAPSRPTPPDTHAQTI